MLWCIQMRQSTKTLTHLDTRRLAIYGMRRRAMSGIKQNNIVARISHTHSSFSAEGVALIEALLDCPNNQEVDRVAVFTDSKSNLETIKRGVATQKEQMDYSRY